MLENDGYLYRDDKGCHSSFKKLNRCIVNLGVAFDDLQFYTDLVSNGNLFVLNSNRNNDFLKYLKNINSNNKIQECDFKTAFSITEIKKLYNNSEFFEGGFATADNVVRTTACHFQIVVIKQSTYIKFSNAQKNEFEQMLKDSLNRNLRFIFISDDIDILLSNSDLVSLFNQHLTIGIFEKWVYRSIFNVNYGEQTSISKYHGLICVNGNISKLALVGLKDYKNRDNIDKFINPIPKFLSKCKVFFPSFVNNINRVYRLYEIVYINDCSWDYFSIVEYLRLHEKDDINDSVNLKELALFINVAQMIYSILVEKSKWVADIYVNNVTLGNRDHIINGRLYKDIYRVDVLDEIKTSLSSLNEKNEHQNEYLQQLLNNKEELEEYINEYIYEFNKCLILSDDRSCKISSIEVENLNGPNSFKFQLNTENNINILFGSNGIGKTTIFNVLDLILNSDRKSIVENLRKLSSFNFKSFLVWFENGYYIIIDKKRLDEKSCNLSISFIFYNKYDGGFPISQDIVLTNEGEVANNKLESYYKILEAKELMFPNSSSPLKHVRVNRQYSASDFLEYIKQYQHSTNVSNKTYSKDKQFSNIKALYDGFTKDYIVGEIKNDITNANLEFRRLLENEKLFNLLDKNSLDLLGKARDLNFLNFDAQDMGLNSRNPKLTTKWVEIIVKSVLDKFRKYLLFKNTFESFYEENDVAKKTLVIVDNEPKFKVSDSEPLAINKLSSGELNLVNIIFNVVYEKDNGKIILIDEPEISLHLSWQERISYVLNSLIEGTNTQIIIASHSPFVCSGDDDLLVGPTYKES